MVDLFRSSRSRSPRLLTRDVIVKNSITGARIWRINNIKPHWKACHLRRFLKVPQGSHFLLEDRILGDDEKIRELVQRPGEPLTLLAVQAVDNTEPGWKRFESRMHEGHFFYRHTGSGKVKRAPPKPWKELGRRGNDGVFYNGRTGHTSRGKPAIERQWPHGRVGPVQPTAMAAVN